VSAVRHLYVHLPFCVHRCGYCDFVTVVGRERDHGAYVDALLGELELEGSVLADPLETVFIGGGTPTFTELVELRRLLDALPAATEVTVEANPETVTPELALLLRDVGVTRVSLGAQSFQPFLLEVLERQAGPDAVRRAFHTLRDVGFDNISLDLLYGIPGQSASDLDADLAEALALAPEHLSYYELEAKPGTRFTHAHGDELGRQAEAMEAYFEQVVETLTGAGYRWYETANFCLTPERAGGRDLRAHHNLGYWRASDYLGVGIGAVSTVGGVRWRNLPSMRGYLAACAERVAPPREVEPLDRETRARERLLLGLRLDEPLQLDPGLESVLDAGARERLTRGGLIEPDLRDPDLAEQGVGGSLALTRRGRFLGGGVTVELFAGEPG
jgi:putative oxygen-independent coproporphyrinogen III oxidase